MDPASNQIVKYTFNNVWLDFLPAGWLEPMLAAHRRLGDDAGIVGNVQLDAATGGVNHAGISFNLKGKPEHIRKVRRHDREQIVHAVTGACMLISADLWRQLGGFDEGFVNGGEDVDLLAVGRDPDEALLAGDGVEVALGVALEAADEVVAGGGGDVGVADALVEVGLAVAVEVVESGDLVAPQHVDGVVRDHQAQGVVQPGRDPPPAHVFQRVVQPRDVPNVALHRADRGGTVGEEVVAAEEHQGVPRVLDRWRDRIDGVGPAGAE